MPAEDLVAGVVLLALVAYAIFGGADFGGGVWSALAFGRRGKEVREAILQAMGPVWETNHVWLILVLVALWTCFPGVFAALFESLFLPLTVALLGIVFRGAAFAFRHYGETTEAGLPATGVVFSIASTITPFAMGIAVGAVADGRIVADGPPPGLFEAWLHPFPLLCGAIALAVCAFLTPFYMLARPLGPLLPEFRRMAPPRRASPSAAPRRSRSPWRRWCLPPSTSASCARGRSPSWPSPSVSACSRYSCSGGSSIGCRRRWPAPRRPP